MLREIFASGRESVANYERLGCIIYTTLFVRTLTAQKKIQDNRKNKQLN